MSHYNVMLCYVMLAQGIQVNVLSILYQAIEELFSLMRLFAGYGHPDLTSEEKTASANFRKNTIMLYLNCLDGVSHWTTLVT